MTEDKLKSILQLLYDELNDNSDHEYTKYLEEKLQKAYDAEKKYDFTETEFVQRIKQLLPDFIEQYKRFKANSTLMANSLDSRFGISISFQLIDLFDIANNCTLPEEFIALRDDYFKKLGYDARMQGFDYIFPGLKDISLSEILTIYNNVLNNVDCITPEWAGKMRCIVDITKPIFIDNRVNDDVFNFGYLDKLANFARSNNMKLRMHNIIWHLDFRPCFENMSKEQIYIFLDEYMSKLSERYSDVLYSIDVLNEIASDEPDKVLRDSKWRDKLGDEYYLDILRIAKKNFPNIELYYNEYGEERTAKRKNIFEIINRIKQVEQEEGITLLDGIGVQAHYSRLTPDDAIKDAFSDYASTGKKLQITEFDVSNDGNSSYDPQTNRVYRTILDCATSFGIKLINQWGVSSTISWKSKRVNNFLDDQGNVSVYSRKLVDTYSKKKKQISLNDTLSNAQMDKN